MKERRIRVNWRSVLLGAGMATVTIVSAAAAAAGLMVKGAVDVTWMGYWAAGILVAAGLVGGLTALLGGGSAVDATLASVGVLVVLMGLNAVLCGGRMEGFAVTALALAGGCGAAVLLRLGRGTGHRRRRRR